MKDIEFAPRPEAGSGMTTDVLYARDGHLGRILLNRPKVINVLNAEMVSSMLAQLASWAQDDEIAAVSIEGAGERGLCAGGDVRAQRTVAMSGTADPVDFWAREYQLNAAIAAYPKPFVAFMDGIVMGGGIGISAHGSLRLVTERSRIAMPETAIGFSPDVGSLFLLSRAPGELGTHLAMTGLSVGGADAIACGLADALVASTEIPGLIAHLAAGGTLTADVGNVSSVGDLAAERDWIASCYAGDDPVAILEALREHPAAGAQSAAEVIVTRSPLAVRVALEAIRRASRMETLAQVLEQDLLLGRAFAGSSDFFEGVRALLVDRDNAPRWRHGSLEEVTAAEVAQMFTGDRHEEVATGRYPKERQRRPRPEPAENAAAPPRDEDVE